jgi:hypothetical protein
MSEKKYLVAVHQRLLHQGNEIDLTTLDQNGLRIVQKFAPASVKEVPVPEKKVTVIPKKNAQPKTKSGKSKVSADVAGGDDQPTNSGESKLVDGAKK